MGIGYEMLGVIFCPGWTNIHDTHYFLTPILTLLTLILIVKLTLTLNLLTLTNLNPNPNSPNHNPRPRTENSLEQIQLSIPGDENLNYSTRWFTKLCS